MKAWCIKSRYGNLLVFAIGHTRKDAWENFCHGTGIGGGEWTEYIRRSKATGVRCVRVTVEETP